MRTVSVISGLLLFVLGLSAQQFVPIHEIQQNRDSTNSSNYMGQIVTTTGIATTDFGMVASSRVFFLEEANGGPWSGIMVYVPSSLGTPDISMGDSIVVTGTVNEYYSNTEIGVGDLADLQVISTGHPLPPVANIYVGYLDTTSASMYDPDSAEAYEHVLAKISNAYVTNTSGPNNDWEITDGTGYAYVRRNGNYTYNPQVGDQVTVTGIVHTYYGLYRMQPRFDDDIVSMAFHLSMAYATSNNSMDVVFTRGIDPATGGDPNNYHLNGGVNITGAQVDPNNMSLVHLQTSTQTPGFYYTLTVNNVLDSLGNNIGTDSISFYGGVIPIETIQSDTSDSGQSNWVGNMITTSGICIVDSTSSSWYYIEEYPGGPWKGIQVYDLDNEPVRGDSVLIVGTVAEYFYMTEISNVMYFDILGTGHPEPDPVTIQTGDLNAGFPAAEPYEGILVNVERATVVNSNPGGSYFEIDDGTGIAQVGNRNAYSYEPHDGDTIGVVGVVRYTSGNYRIEPRGDDDLDLIYVGVGESDNHANTIPLRIVDFPTVSRSNPYMMITTTSVSPINIRLFDATGRRILSLRTKPKSSRYGNVIRIDLNKRGSLASGAYFVVVEQDNHRLVRPFIKVN